MLKLLQLTRVIIIITTTINGGCDPRSVARVIGCGCHRLENCPTIESTRKKQM